MALHAAAGIIVLPQRPERPSPAPASTRPRRQWRDICPPGGREATDAADAVAMNEELKLFCKTAQLGHGPQSKVFSAVAARCSMAGEIAEIFLGNQSLDPSKAPAMDEET